MRDHINPLRVLIVDDETLARTRLRRMLSALPAIVIVGEARNGDELHHLLPGLRPDLILLDVEMPGRAVFDTVSAFALGHATSVVFVTAHDRYAMQAFDVEAVDFVRKPVSADRLTTAIERVQRRRASTGKGSQELLHAIRALEERQRAIESSVAVEPPSYAQRMLVKNDGAEFPLSVSAIESFEASHNSVGLRTATGVYSIRGTLTGVEASLDPATFARIHRSVIVNLDHVQQVQPWFWGDSVVIMKRGTKLRMSRRFREAFYKRFLAPRAAVAAVAQLKSTHRFSGV